MERISARLWHPSCGEVEQEAMAAQEASLRDTLKEHRLAANPVNWGRHFGGGLCDRAQVYLIYLILQPINVQY